VKPVQENDLLDIFEQVKNWGRWGAEDERGTLNLVTAEKIRQAAGLIEAGHPVSCGGMDFTPSVINATPPTHYMIAGGDIAQDDYGVARDYFGIPPHGPGCTHLDALCHVFFRGRMYNNRPASMVTSAGAMANSILAASSGITTRGVLLDIPRLRDVPFFGPEQPVRAAELDDAERKAGVSVTDGDALIVRLGRLVRRRELGAGAERVDGRVHFPGLHPDCLPWLHARGVSLLVSDAGQDALPSGYQHARAPIHIGALVFMGLHLLDQAILEDLAQECVRRQRWEFYFTVAPLTVPGGTGSPVNPLAIF
jgi:kynurenine formamidase